MKLEPTKQGKEIEEHLSYLNTDPWFHIYENYIKNDSKNTDDEIS